MKSRRARVAHVINSVGLGGVPEAVFQLLRHLPGPRFEPHIIVLRPFVNTDAARVERLSKLESLGLPITFVPAGRHKLATITGLLEIFANEKFEIIHAHSYRPNLFARMAALLLKPTGPRIVGHYHNKYDANWDRDGTQALDRSLAARSDRLVACSGAVRDHISERLGVERSGISVVPNGADLERFQIAVDRQQARASFGLPADGPVITLVGRISEQKGQIDLARAAPAILSRFPSATFVFAGLPDESQTQQHLEEEIARSGHPGSFRLLGFVDRMPDLYAATDVLAAPSRWEGFGLMLVEAMAAGIPIVAARTGGIPEVTGEADGAILIESADSAALSAAVIRTLSDHELAAGLIARGRARATQFSWQNSADALTRIYEELVEA